MKCHQVSASRLCPMPESGRSEFREKRTGHQEGTSQFIRGFWVKKIIYPLSKLWGKIFWIYFMRVVFVLISRHWIDVSSPHFNIYERKSCYTRQGKKGRGASMATAADGNWGTPHGVREPGWGNYAESRFRRAQGSTASWLAFALKCAWWGRILCSGN